jgi:hypothetical protein
MLQSLDTARPLPRQILCRGSASRPADARQRGQAENAKPLIVKDVVGFVSHSFLRGVVTCHRLSSAPLLGKPAGPAPGFEIHRLIRQRATRLTPEKLAPHDDARSGASAAGARPERARRALAFDDLLLQVANGIHTGRRMFGRVVPNDPQLRHTAHANRNTVGSHPLVLICN